MTREISLTDKPLWLKALLGLGLILYAFLASKALEPRMALPASVLDGVAWVEKGEAHSLSKMRGRHFLSASAIATEIGKLEREMYPLGGLERPVLLVIDGDEPLKYQITDSRIELGVRVAERKGQILKAVLKTWLYQSTPPEISSSLLRRDVLSDVLLGILRGKFVLEVPGYEKALVLADLGSWVRAATSFSRACESAWRNLELPQLCESQRTSPLGFRELLSSVIWRTYSSLPLRQRGEFLRAWVMALSQPRGQAQERRLSRGSFTGWREWLRVELDELLPARHMHEATGNDGFVSAARISSLMAGLTSKDVVVDAILRLPEGSFDALSKFLRPQQTALVTIGEETLLLPGRVKLDRDEVTELKARVSVWQTCESPSIGEVLGLKDRSERIVHIQACGATKVDFEPLFKWGVPSFVSRNPELAFVQIRSKGLDLALAKQAVKPSTRLAELTSTKTASFPRSLLGSASWNADLQAYSVLGPIEAVEFFRQAPRKDEI